MVRTVALVQRLAPVVLVLLCCLLSAARTGHATPSSRLTYMRGAGAEECPDEAGLRSRVSERLGYDPFFAWAERTLIVSFEHTRERFSGRIHVLDARGLLQGERMLEPRASCDELASASALVISLLLDALDTPSRPTEVDRETEPLLAAPSADEPTAPTQAPPTRAARPAPAAVPPRVPWTFAALAGPSLVAVVTPSPSVGGMLAAELGRGPWHLGLDLEATSSARASSAASRGSVSVGLMSLGASGCYHAGIWFGCGAVRTGWFRFASHDLDTTRTAARGFVSLGPRTGLQVALGPRLFVRAQLDADILLQRYDLLVRETSVETTEPRYETARVDLRSAILLGLRFF